MGWVRLLVGTPLWHWNSMTHPWIIHESSMIHPSFIDFLPHVSSKSKHSSTKTSILQKEFDLLVPWLHPSFCSLSFFVQPDLPKFFLPKLFFPMVSSLNCQLIKVWSAFFTTTFFTIFNVSPFIFAYLFIIGNNGEYWK